MRVNRDGPIISTPTEAAEAKVIGYRPVVCLDEMWVNAHHHVSKYWVDSDGRGGLKVPSGKGKCLIVLRDGWKGGWIPSAKVILQSGCDSENYH